MVTISVSLLQFFFFKKEQQTNMLIILICQLYATKTISEQESYWQHVIINSPMNQLVTYVIFLKTGT